jgi:ABC-type Fe3+-hydroxamate transport system substrate-binding protein
MVKRRYLVALILCLGGAGLLICGVFPGHKRGTASSPSHANRIACLAPNLTEIAFALGLGERVVAVSNDSDYPTEVVGKDKVGTFWQPSTEAIIASKPDLVLTLWFEQQKAVAESLRRLGYQVIILKIEKIQELLAAIRKIGKVTGTEQRANQLAQQIENRLNDLRVRFNSNSQTRVLWVVQAQPLRVAGTNTFINGLIEIAGGKNAIGPTIQQYPPVGTEEILACGAEVIIQSAMGPTAIRAQQRAAETFWNRWPNLPAARNNRIYVVEPDTILRLGPRLCHGVEVIARCLHPDLFEQVQRNPQSIR